MGNWKIEKSSPDMVGMAMKTVATGGVNLLFGDKPDTKYTVRNTETNEVRQVTSTDTAALGRSLAKPK
jgi:hypothetical protein